MIRYHPMWYQSNQRISQQPTSFKLNKVFYFTPKAVFFLDPPCTVFFRCHRAELRWESLGRTFPPAGTSWSRDTESRMGSQFYHRNGPRALESGGYENLKLYKTCGWEPMNLGNHRYPLCLVIFFIWQSEASRSKHWRVWATASPKTQSSFFHKSLRGMCDLCVIATRWGGSCNIPRMVTNTSDLKGTTDYWFLTLHRNEAVPVKECLIFQEFSYTYTKSIRR